MTTNDGRDPAGQALAVPATPLRVDGPSGFDPSRKFDPASYDGKPRHLPRDDSQLLRSFIEPMYERIQAMSLEDLADFISACRRVSPVNCGWDEYALAKMLHDVALSDYNAAIATEARRAETSLGSVHESAGRRHRPDYVPKGQV